MLASPCVFVRYPTPRTRLVGSPADLPFVEFTPSENLLGSKA